MKILVTGATGFIGQHLIRNLLDNGHSITAVARKQEKATNFDWFNDVCFVACDIHKPISNPFEYFGKPEMAIHLAWPNLPNYKAMSHIETSLFKDYSFLKSLIVGGLRQLCVTGSCFEYGMKNGCLTEELATRPSNPYAIAKDSLRLFLQSLQCQCSFNLKWIRFFYMYGKGQNSNSILAQLDQALDRGEDCFNMSGGEQLRDYLPIEEVTRRLTALIGFTDFDGIINICSGRPISIRNLVEKHLLKRNQKIHLNLGYYPYPDYEPFSFWGSSEIYNQIITKNIQRSSLK